MKGIKMINKIYLDESEAECTMCGMCESICDEVFDASGVMKVKDVDLNLYQSDIKQAIISCPSGCIASE